MTDSPAAPPPPSPGQDARQVQGKGRPTPKRSEQQRRRTGPVTPPPQTRKEAAQRQRERMKAERRAVKDGTAPPRLLARDVGPVRKLVRDVVDSRRSVGVLLLPLALVLVVAQAVGDARVQNIAISMWMTGVLLMVVDVVVTSVIIRRRVRAAFPDERSTRGHVVYGLLRSTVFRRWRMPPPTVAPPGLRG